MQRQFALFVVIAVELLAVTVAAEAQQAVKAPRIGFLCAMSGPSAHTREFQQGLRDLGYVEGKNLVVEYRFAAGNAERFADFATEMVRLKVDVIVAASPPAIRPAQQATRAIPIVMAQSDDPVRSGFVVSLARPGGNITGLSALSAELSGKRLHLLKQAVPALARVAILRNAASPVAEVQFRETAAAARALGVQVQSVEVQSPTEFERAFSAMTRERANGVIVLPDMMFFENRVQLVDLAGKHRLPAIYEEQELAEIGGLIAYGPSSNALFKRSAAFVDKILKGARPAGLPVEQPAKFELFINLRTAEALGLTIPQSLLVQADEIIVKPPAVATPPANPCALRSPSAPRNPCATRTR